MYVVVRFIQEEKVELIPQSWVINTKYCVWPPYKAPDKTRKAIKQEEQRKDNWDLYEIKILSKPSMSQTY